MKPQEIPWLQGHRFQQQYIFPAAGYCVIAIEAMKAYWGSDPVRLIETEDLRIHKAIYLQEDSAGVEAVFSLINSNDGIVYSDGSEQSCRRSSRVAPVE